MLKIQVVTAVGKIRLVREKHWDQGDQIKDKIVAGVVEKSVSPPFSISAKACFQHQLQAHP